MTDRLKAWLDETSAYSNPARDMEKVLRALRAVVELHSEFRIYDECSHQHTDEEVTAGTAFDVEDVGITCEEGYLYSVCKKCHTDDGDVTEDTPDGEWPCEELRAIEKEVLG
jgi:hypothetical protein